MWLPREGYEVRVPSTKSHWFSSWRWPTRPTFNILKLHQPLWSSCFRETRKRWVPFYSGHSYSISPAACSLEWSPKPWHQPARRWNSALLYSLEWLSILSGCTSGMYSWIQNFPVDSRSRVFELWALTQPEGVTAHLSSEGASHSIYICSLRWEKESLLHLDQRVKSW